MLAYTVSGPGYNVDLNRNLVTVSCKIRSLLEDVETKAKPVGPTIIINQDDWDDLPRWRKWQMIQAGTEIPPVITDFVNCFISLLTAPLERVMVALYKTLSERIHTFKDPGVGVYVDTMLTDQNFKKVVACIEIHETRIESL